MAEKYKGNKFEFAVVVGIALGIVLTFLFKKLAIGLLLGIVIAFLIFFSRRN